MLQPLDRWDQLIIVGANASKGARARYSSHQIAVFNQTQPV